MNSKVKKGCQIIFRQVTILCVGGVIGLIALILAFCIPTQPMKEHVAQSMPMIEREWGTFVLIEGYPASLPGSFTDCLMLGNAIYSDGDHTLLERALNGYRCETSEGGDDDWATGYSLKDYIEGKSGREIEYARYWHGYLVILKPLIFFTNLNTLHMIAGVLQLILIGILIINYAHRGYRMLAYAFLTAIPFLYFFSLYASLSLSVCLYIMLGTLLIQDKYHDKIQMSGKYGEFFLCVGAATSYFDFLTYPLVTLGFPLCVALYMGCKNFKEGARRIILYSVEWCIGYVGFWGIKWVMTDLLVGGNICRNAFETILVRTSSSEGHSLFGGFIDVLHKNADLYFNWAFFLLIIAAVILFGRHFWTEHGYLMLQQSWQPAIAIMLVALFPLVWFFLTQNHSEQHWVYTCKIISVSVFAIFCAVAKLLSASSKEYPAFYLAAKGKP